MSLLRTKLRTKLIQFISQTPRSEPMLKLMRLYCDTLDGETTGDIKYNGELRVARECLPDSDVVIDVGAHTGQWATHALCVNPNLNLFCIEPLRANFETLLQNSKLSSAKCSQVALGSSHQDLLMDRGTQSIHRVVSKDTEKTMQMTLDDFLSRENLSFVDYLKIDVEGHEFEVLKGARKALSHGRIKRIQFEYGPEWIFARVQLRDVFRFLEKHRFVMHHIRPSSTTRVDQYSSWLENYRYKNFLAIHSTELK